MHIGTKEVSARRAKACQAMRKEDQFALPLSKMSRRNSSVAFCALDEPLEAVIFSVLVEI